jgi:hypothetical protein
MYVQVGVGLGVRSGAGFELFACWPFDTAHLVDLELVQAAQAAGIPFRAVVADSLYGEHPEFTRVLWQADLPFVLAVKPSEIVWTLPPSRPLPPEAADRLRWGPRNDAQHPGPGRRCCAASMTGTKRRGGRWIWSWAAPMGPSARTGWWSPPAIRARCPKPVRGTWSPISRCRARRGPASTLPCRRRIWRRWCGSTAYASGSSKATSR